MLSYLDELKTKIAQHQDFDDFLRSKSAIDFDSTEEVIVFINDAVIEFGLPVLAQLEKYIHGQYALWHKRSDVIDLTKIDVELERLKKALKNTTVSTTLVSSGSVISQTNLVAQPSNESGQTDLVSANSPNRKKGHFLYIVCILINLIALFSFPESMRGWYFLFLVVLFFVIWLLYPADKLSQNFQKLGDMRGMTCSEIEAVLGPCTSKSMQLGSNGKAGVVRTWHKIGFRVSLMFDKNGNFVDVISKS